jgi:hypothetical protein
MDEKTDKTGGNSTVSTYFWICMAMFAAGVILLGIGAALKEKLPPKVAAALIVIGVGMAMVFMNICLVLQMMGV